MHISIEYPSFSRLAILQLFTYVLPLEIQLSRCEGRDPMNRFNPATFLWCPRPRLGFLMSYMVVFFCFYSVS